MGYGVPGSTDGGLVLEAEQEAGADEDAAHRELDAGLEAASGRALAVQRQRGIEVGLGHRAPVGAPGQGRDDLAGAGRFLVGRRAGRRRADEQLAAAGRVAGRRGLGHRPGDRHARHHRLAVRGPVRIAAQGGVEQVLDIGRGLGREVHLHEVRAGGDRRLEAHALEDEPVPLVAARPLGSLHDARPHPRAVDAHVQLVGLGGDALEAAGDAALLRPKLEVVLTVGGEVVGERGAAARAERQVVADADALVAVGGHEDGLGGGGPPRPAEGHLRDAGRRAQVALGQGRRQGEGVGVVVEAVGGVVGGQQGGVDVHREEVADGVAVLGPVQAVQRGTAGIGVREGGAVEFGLEPRHHLAVGGPIGPGASRRGHRAGPQLVDHGLPDLGVIAGARHVEDVEGQSRRQGALVVAREAVALEDGSGCGSVRGLARDGGLRPGGLPRRRAEWRRNSGQGERHRQEPAVKPRGAGTSARVPAGAGRLCDRPCRRGIRHRFSASSDGRRARQSDAGPRVTR